MNQILLHNNLKTFFCIVTVEILFPFMHKYKPPKMDAVALSINNLQKRKVNISISASITIANFNLPMYVL